MKRCDREGCENVRKSIRHLYCDDVECNRQRARERRRKADNPKPATEPEVEERNAGGVFAATISALTDAGRVHTPAAQNALAVATRIDFGASDTGSSLAALSKQHLAALTEALRDVEAAQADSVDELRRRRESRSA